MEQFTFKGSIPEAIVEAKQQKKLFVVYVSGNDGASVPADESAFVDLDVAASITKYCIFLHLVQGSTEASQFSAIYPQKSVPCVTIIGYNGVMLAQHEGLINYEILVSSAKQGWISLQIRETAATAILSKAAALASSNTQAQSSSSSSTTSFEQGRSSSSEMPSSSKEESLQNSKQTKEKQDEARTEETIAALASNKTEAQTPDSSNTTSFEQGGSSSSEILAPSKEKSCQDLKEQQLLIAKQNLKDQQLLIAKQKKEKQEEAIAESKRARENRKRSSDVVSGRTKTEESRVLKDSGLESVGAGIASNVMKTLDNITDARKSTDVHLNIRLPDGASLQKKFSVTDTLGSVKNYVDENQSSLGAYDLAVPYPRRVFSEQDLRKELSELELLNRQALIVVQHHRSSSLIKRLSFSGDVNTSNEGYFGSVKRLLSYVNPFSYLGNSVSATSSGQGPNEGLWQYRPNPDLRNQLSGPERTNIPYSPNTNTTGTNQNTSKSSKPTVSGFGSSNVHTLNNYRNDDGPASPNDRNTFWNGNSTEYGGNNNDNNDGK
ncbi:hypothetical protein C5167_019283 [Papaver somniferum]|uniref:UBX domain-containing protein n=1 Tax=Papaver somniferum TaxID=3469 RepID=A0A4Y7ITU4_PAPSO|nr:plant UBX domain-containing protein 11-like [Papaver somniferum]RZC50855.1 hypothetical protein C5167_019283 [Papaver somniferum]